MNEEIIEKDGKKYKVIEVMEEPTKDKVIVNGWGVTEYEKWYDPKYCLKAVKQDGWVLQYVRVQTPGLCEMALKQNGNALQFVDKRVFKK